MKTHAINNEKERIGDKYPARCGAYVSIHMMSGLSDITCLTCLGKAKITPILKVEILEEEITISTIRDNIEVVHWVQDEWIEDPKILPCIANAIHMAHTDPDKLLHLNWRHLESQYRMRDVYFQPSAEDCEKHCIPSFCVWRSKDQLLKEYPGVKVDRYSGDDIEEPTFMG